MFQGFENNSTCTSNPWFRGSKGLSKFLGNTEISKSRIEKSPNCFSITNKGAQDKSEVHWIPAEYLTLILCIIIDAYIVIGSHSRRGAALKQVRGNFWWKKNGRKHKIICAIMPPLYCYRASENLTSSASNSSSCL